MSIVAAQIDETGLVKNIVMVEERDLIDNNFLVSVPFAASDDGNLISTMPVSINETKYINNQFVDIDNQPLTIDMTQINLYNKRISAAQTPPEVY